MAFAIGSMFFLSVYGWLLYEFRKLIIGRSDYHEILSGSDDYISGKPHFAPPYYYGYRGGYANVTVCIECGRTALYEDQHPVDPCPDCGNIVAMWDDKRRKLSAKWANHKWVFAASSANPEEISLAYHVKNPTPGVGSSRLLESVQQ